MTGEVRKVERTIQHTAPLTRGNSGGPLINRDGEVVVILTRAFDTRFTTAIWIGHATR